MAGEEDGTVMGRMLNVPIVMWQIWSTMGDGVVPATSDARTVAPRVRKGKMATERSDRQKNCEDYSVMRQISRPIRGAGEMFKFIG
jgi:hypothetical protein